jgi:hypothetical protein
MLKLSFTQAEELIPGISLLADDLHIQLVPAAEADIQVAVVSLDEDRLDVAWNGRAARIAYGGGTSRFFRALGLLVEASLTGQVPWCVEETPRFITNGAMLDASRNAVMRPEMVKIMMRKMALMGLNTFLLYIEDTYEIPQRPYFGHMRGRYTQNEIRDMDAYALKLGIELVPCIQFLAHLATALQWPCTVEYRDTSDTLLVGAEETYHLIHDMLESVAASFSSRRLHVGLDEAHTMGRGRFLDRNGHVPRAEIFCRHLQTIIELAKPYGFRLMMWSDMFFRTASPNDKYYETEVVFSEAVRAMVPRDVQQVYWDYDESEATTYEKMIIRHKELCDDIIFAGGIWMWIGPTPHYRISIRNAREGLAACAKHGVREVLATIWHNGAEASLITALPVLQLYAELDYTGIYDEEAWKRRFAFTCQASPDVLLQMEKADQLADAGLKANPSRYLLFNDPLLGLLDKHVKQLDIDVRAYYKELKRWFNTNADGQGLFTEALLYYKALLDVLILKADFGVRLKAAYDKRDQAGLQQSRQDAHDLIERFGKLRQAHRQSWLFYNKPFGFEMFDMMYGALAARFDTVVYRLDQLRNDPQASIAELEEERLWFDCREDESLPAITQISPRFGRLYTAGVYASCKLDNYIG